MRISPDTGTSILNMRGLSKIQQRLFKGSFAKHVAMISGGTALAQVLAVLAGPVLTRLYPAADFGLLQFYMSIISIFAIVTCWRYEQAIPLPEDDQTAVNLMVLCLGLLVGMSLLIGAGVWLLADRLAAIMDDTRLCSYLWLIPFSLVAVGFYQIMNYWAIRKKAFPRIARTKLHQGVGMVVGQIGLGLVKLGPLGLLLGDLFGRAGGGLTLGALVWRSDRESLRAISLPGVLHAAKAYADFPKYSTGTALVSVLSTFLPGLLLPLFFSMTVSGYYYWAYRVLTLPVTLIGQSFSMVFYKRAADCYSQRGDLRKLVVKSFVSLTGVAVIPGAILMVYAPFLFQLVLGEEYRIAGEYVRLILPWMVTVFIVQSLNSVLMVVGKQNVRLCYDVVQFALRGGAFVLGALVIASPLWAIGLFSAVGCMANIGMGMLIWYYANTKKPQEVRGAAHA